MPKGIKGYVKGYSVSPETRKKIGDANRRQIYFNCDYCGKCSSDKPSHFKRKKNHFCSRACYAAYVKKFKTKEEHYNFGKGVSLEEKKKRIKAISTLNHYLRDKKIKRPPCEICGEMKSEAHHIDYDKPLEVKWLCFTHHRLYHKIGDEIYKIHETPELLK